MHSPESVIEHLAEHDIAFVDFRFTDILGRKHHLTVPRRMVTLDLFESGLPFDGATVPGWRSIEASTMVLLPDASTMRQDPFREEPTVNITCNVADPSDLKGYERDPRSIAQRAETWLQTSGIGDTAYFGPEPEFYVFDSVSWDEGPGGCFVRIVGDQASWSRGLAMDGRNPGHRPGKQGGYVPVPPMDAFHDIRSEMCLLLEQQGIPVELHHHEMGGSGQLKIGTGGSTLVRRADWNQILKYTVHNVAHVYGKTATFMPKPVVSEAGSGMHVHQSIWKDGENQFAGDGYAGLSDTALHYIGGIMKHARALNAITNPSTNSYKRLVPYFEAPVKLAYSARNRSASIQVPYASNPSARRIEACFPDAIANPYLAFAALLMAGLDGIQNRIDPGDPTNKKFYDQPPEKDAAIPTVSTSLDEALDALDKDRHFLLRGGVFTHDMLDTYINLKRAECDRLRIITHPVEFDMYYSL